MRISPEVEIAVTLATREAIRRRHEYVTVDHLLYALLFDEAVSRIIKKAGGNIAKLKKDVEEFLDDDMDPLPDDEDATPALSLGFQRVLSRALAHVQSSGEDEVTGANVLVALYAERESDAVPMHDVPSSTSFDTTSCSTINRRTYVRVGFGDVDFSGSFVTTGDQGLRRSQSNLPHSGGQRSERDGSLPRDPLGRPLRGQVARPLLRI